MEMSKEMRKSLERISRWGKIYGVIMIIAGVFSALIGLFAFGIGAIPGVISLYLGYLIYKTGADAKEMLLTEGDPLPLESLMMNYGRYLLMNMIYLVASIVFVVIIAMIGITLSPDSF